jgi:hypothetical protein
MSAALTDGPFGPGDRPGAMPHGDFLDPEPGCDPSGLTVQDVHWGLDGQPQPAKAGSWGDMSWLAPGVSHGGIPIIGG